MRSKITVVGFVGALGLAGCASAVVPGGVDGGVDAAREAGPARIVGRIFDVEAVANCGLGAIADDPVRVRWGFSARGFSEATFRVERAEMVLSRGGATLVQQLSLETTVYSSDEAGEIVRMVKLQGAPARLENVCSAFCGGSVQINVTVRDSAGAETIRGEGFTLTCAR